MFTIFTRILPVEAVTWMLFKDFNELMYGCECDDFPPLTGTDVLIVGKAVEQVLTSTGIGFDFPITITSVKVLEVISGDMEIGETIEVSQLGHPNCEKVYYCKNCTACSPIPCASGHNQRVSNCTQCTRCNARLSRNCTISKPCKFHEPQHQEYPIGNGLILGNSTSPGIADALEIFKKLAGMENQIKDMY